MDLVTQLPEDAILEILVKLPAKSLLRFKPVCKTWKTTIERSDFIHRQATQEDTSKLGTLIYQAHREFDPITGTYRLFVYFAISGDQEFDKFDRLGRPPHFHNDDLPGVNISGSCHGIICLYNCDRKVRDVVLWNPATKQYRLLPESPTPIASVCGDFIGDFVAFGYDVKSKDYKVLQVTTFLPVWTNNSAYGGYRTCSDRIERVQVYSLSSDSWRCIDDAAKLNAHCTACVVGNQGRYLKGKYFFLGQNYFPTVDEQSGLPYCGNMSVIVSFDFSKETFDTIQVPGECKDAFGIDFIGEKIACIVSTGSDGAMFDIWVLNEYCTTTTTTTTNTNATGSWTKLYSVSAAQSELSMGTMGISRNGEFAVLKGSRGVYLLNLITREIKLKVPILDIFFVDVYKSSLVSVGRKDPKTRSIKYESN